jgi:hypothetical protein
MLACRLPTVSTRTRQFRYAVVLIFLLAVLAAGLVYVSKNAPPSATTASAGRPTFDAATIDAALQSDRPYVISVLGDSTSKIAGAWIYLVSQRIAGTYHRAVTVHDWSIETNSYPDTQTFGSGAPVTVWNGSARGKSAQYSLQWFRQMAPEQADLTIINHTHNNPWHAVEGISELVDCARRNTRPGGGVVVMLQNPRTDTRERAELEQQVIDKLRIVYNAPGTGVITVDANAAFRAGDLSVLLRPDGAHPSEQGSKLWADTVISTLMLR